MPSIPVTVRVRIGGRKPNGEEVNGSVVINVAGDCDMESILQHAMDYVDAGGFFASSHGAYDAIAETSVVDSISIGHSSNASTTLQC